MNTMFFFNVFNVFIILLFYYFYNYRYFLNVQITARELQSQKEFNFVYNSLLQCDDKLSLSLSLSLSSPKPINSGVPQGSVVSPTHFLLFMNDLLSVTNCPIHAYADDSTLHFLTSFDRRPTLQDLQDSRLEAAERSTSDLAIISDLGGRNLVFFNA